MKIVMRVSEDNKETYRPKLIIIILAVVVTIILGSVSIGNSEFLDSGVQEYSTVNEEEPVIQQESVLEQDEISLSALESEPNISEKKCINLLDYSEYVGTDGDWSVSIAKAELAALAEDCDLYFPAGEYKITNYMIKIDQVNWIGDGEQSILYFGDDFHSDNTRINDSNYIIITEHQNKETPDCFQISNICFEHRLTTAADFDISGFFLMTYTDGVILENVTVKYNSGENAKKTRIFDFKAANCNSVIRNCNISGSNGGIGFRNFAEDPCTNLLIENNKIMRSRGSVDEGIWVCANVGPIKGVTITGNTIISEDNADLSSGIYVVQADGYTSRRNNDVSDVTITNNHIEVNHVMYYGINVGTYLEGFPDIENVIVSGNTLIGHGIKEYTTCGIACQHTENAKISDNKIIGAFQNFILGGDIVKNNVIVEENNIDNIETTGIAYSETVSQNTVTVSQIGFKDCTTLTENKITAATNYIHTAKEIMIRDNEFIRLGTRGNYLIAAYVTGSKNGFEKPVVSLINNIFHCDGKTVLYGDMVLTLRDNYADYTYAYQDAFGEVYQEIDNNTIVTPSGITYIDSELQVRNSISECPEALRLSLPIGYSIKVYESTSVYRKQSTGKEVSAWCLE